MKDGGASPHGYTEKYQELLSFLDKASSGLAEETTTDVNHQRGLCDISNHQDKTRVAAAAAAASNVATSKTTAVLATTTGTSKREKYIWDIYDEESEKAVVKLEDDDIGPASDDDGAEGAKRPPLLPVDARKQLSELHNAVETIRKQFSSMKNELETKRRVVEDLHKERLAAEKSHVDAVKLLQQVHSAKFDETERRSKEVRELAHWAIGHWATIKCCAKTNCLY